MESQSFGLSRKVFIDLSVDTFFGQPNLPKATTRASEAASRLSITSVGESECGITPSHEHVQLKLNVICYKDFSRKSIMLDEFNSAMYVQYAQGSSKLASHLPAFCKAIVVTAVVLMK